MSQAITAPTTASTSHDCFAAGALVGLALVCVAALPAAFRLAGSGAGGLPAWLVLVGGSAPLVALAAGACRSVRPLPRALLSMILGAGLGLPLVLALSALLHAKTHHRPLAAATFAVVASLLFAGAAVLVRRLLALLAEKQGAARGWLRSLLVLLVTVSVVALLAVVYYGVREAHPVVRGVLLDGALIVLSVAVGGFLPLPSGLLSRVRLRYPLGAAAALFAGGAWAFSIPAVLAASTERAPLLVGLLWLTFSA